MGAVHAGLSANSAIHLGEKSCRHLDEGDAAQQNACGETGEVADDSAAERYQDGRPLYASLQDVFQDAAERTQVLAALTRVDNQGGAGKSPPPRREPSVASR